MTTAGSVTCLVADIVGSSLIMQQDQRRAIALFETFHSLLLPVIVQHGGKADKYTGDEVSAAFDDCLSALAAGFEIQDILQHRNQSSDGADLLARIGIYCAEKGSDQQQLALAAATRLQSLGRADAICLSGCDIDAIGSAMPVFIYPRGKHDLGFLTEPAAVYYLFENKQSLASRLKLQFEYFNADYISRLKHAVSLPVMAIPLLLVFDLILFQLLQESPFSGTRYIEMRAIRDFTSGEFKAEIVALNHRLENRLNTLTEQKVVLLKPESGNSPIHDYESRLRLVPTFQHQSGQVRLSWGIYGQDGKVQNSGGVLTDKVEYLAGLERQFIQEIVSELVSPGELQR